MTYEYESDIKWILIWYHCATWVVWISERYFSNWIFSWIIVIYNLWSFNLSGVWRIYISDLTTIDYYSKVLVSLCCGFVSMARCKYEILNHNLCSLMHLPQFQTVIGRVSIKCGRGPWTVDRLKSGLLPVDFCRWVHFIASSQVHFAWLKSGPIIKFYKKLNSS